MRLWKIPSLEFKMSVGFASCHHTRVYWGIGHTHAWAHGCRHYSISPLRCNVQAILQPAEARTPHKFAGVGLGHNIITAEVNKKFNHP